MENQAAVMTGVRTIELREIEMPSPAPDEVVVNMEYAGICGSDAHFFEDGHIGATVVQPPFILGHECAGTVCQVGGAVKTLAVGDRVALEPGIPCGSCDFCKQGRYNLCREMRFRSNPPVNGLLQRYAAHPAHLCFKLPETVSSLEGALIEPLAVGIHAARLGEAGPCKTAVILGAGCIGLTTLLACKLARASRVIVTDLYESRLQKARELGADETVNGSAGDSVEQILALTGGEGADIVFEAAGNKATAAQTSFLVARGGRIVLVGAVTGEVPFNFRNLSIREADLKTVWRYRNAYPEAIQAAASGAVDLKGIVSDQFDFSETQQAFERSINDRQHVIKAIVRF